MERELFFRCNSNRSLGTRNFECSMVMVVLYPYSFLTFLLVIYFYALLQICISKVCLHPVGLPNYFIFANTLKLWIVCDMHNIASLF